MDATTGYTIIIFCVGFLSYFARSYFWNGDAYLQSDHHSSPDAAKAEVLDKMIKRKVIDG